MCVSPVDFAFPDLKVLKEAERTFAVTHNHPEGIKSTQAFAAAIFMRRQGQTKDANYNSNSNNKKNLRLNYG